MKMKCLLAVCAAFFLASCSNDDDLQYSPQHGDIVGLNIKDAKYIYYHWWQYPLFLYGISAD